MAEKKSLFRGLVDNLKPKARTRSGVKIKQDDLYNYSTLETREATIRFLFSYAKTGRSSLEEYWALMRRYYDGEHDTPKQMAAFCESQGLPWYPAQCTDGYIHVETQIDPTIPDFEFSGRDDDTDNLKAKVREKVVRFVLDNNPMELMNTRNERRMNLKGTAAWKVAWDMSIVKPNIIGDIVIGNPKVEQLFWDTSSGEDIDKCESFPLVYRMHKMAVKRYFAKDLKRIGKSIDDFALGFGREDTELSADSDNYDTPDYTLQIMEWWFLQPDAGSETIEDVEYEWEAGSIACVILINQEEVRYIPKYWRKTNCSMYPFSVYCKVPNDDDIHGKSEIEMIKDLMDGTDRQLAYAQLNDAFTANDIVLMEENAIADDGELSNMPGSVWKVKPEKINAVRRLSNLTPAHVPMYQTADRYKEMMQQTNGNFDVNQGDAPPSNVNTLGGQLQLQEQGNKRQNIKKFDRMAGMKRLIRLIDYTALENYDDGRIIYIGAKSKDSQSVNFSYNSDIMRMTGKDGKEYYPEVDVKMQLSNGIQKSKALTIQALNELSKMTITPQNYKFIQAYIDELDIPQRVELNAFIEEVVQPPPLPPPDQDTQGFSMKDILDKGGFTPEELNILEQQPELAHQAAQQNGVQIT